MPAITRDSLHTLEAYARARPGFRAEVIAHKKNRHVALGPHVTLLFEDELTIRYQIQEMLRVEKIFEEAGIAEELSAYNPLIPDGDNWKATMLIEYEDPVERARMLARLKGVEDMVWVRIGDGSKIHPIADEDLERENAHKTSSVHFLRFQLPASAIAAVRAGAEVAMGVDHPEYRAEVAPVPPAVRAALLKDLA